MSQRITPGQAFRVGEIAAESTFGSDLTKEESQFVLEHRTSELAGELVRLVRQLSWVQVVETPADLREVLERQVDRLVSVEVYKTVGVSKATYHDQLMAAVKAFQWRPELATIGLGQVVLVDYRLHGNFLAEAGEVKCYIDLDKYENYQGLETADGVMVIQYQPGPKYRNKSPSWCRGHFHELEQGLVIVEALTVFLHAGVQILKDCYMDIPGSISGLDGVPCLDLWYGKPKLRDEWDGYADRFYGSASRGKCKPLEP